jgi:thiol-disulfide isomerase/thioredoxin
MHPRLLSLPLVLLTCSLALAQEPPSLPELSKRLSAAASTKDPAARVKALHEFLQLPNLPAPIASSAQRQFVIALVKHDPAAAPKAVAALAKNTKGDDQARLFQTLSSELLAAQHPAPALDAARRAAKVRGASQPHLYQEALGLALHANGRSAEARKALESALRANPASSPAANKLAEIAEAEGRAAHALDLRAHAFLARPSKESWDRLTAAWAGRPNLEDFLDQRYQAIFPPSLHPKPFRGEARRTVLAELYTGAGCPPCAAADLAFDAAMERYARHNVAVVMYHVHVPRPDPMTNSDTKSRWDWQKGRGVPTYAVDGVATTGGGPRSNAPSVLKELQTRIDEALTKDARAQLSLSARQHGASVTVRAQLGHLPPERDPLRLHLVLVEKQIRYSGENSIRFHPMVARGIASLPLNGEPAVDHTFDLNQVETALRAHLDDFEKFDERHNKEGEFRFRVRTDSLNRDNLAVVAYIQNTETREVLQAAFVDPAATERTSR